MNYTDDSDRLIQEVLTELGWDVEPPKIAEGVRRLDLGLPREDQFIAICNWLGKALLVHKLDQQQAPLKSRDTYRVPDVLAQFEQAGPLLIEVKSKSKQTLSFTPDYLERLSAYAELVNMPLLIAWRYRGIWVLFEARHLTKARKNFNIRFSDAMRENLLGVLAGDVSYKIAPGAGVRFRCKKVELLMAEKDGDTRTEQWRMRIDEIGFTVAGGEAVGKLDPEVSTLFTTWDLEERQSHSDTHVELQFVAGNDGMMFGHMALTHLLNWTLPQGRKINWRHAIRRDVVVSNMINFRQVGIPRQSCHPFHAESCHRFHGKVATHSTVKVATFTKAYTPIGAERRMIDNPVWCPPFQRGGAHATQESIHAKNQGNPEAEPARVEQPGNRQDLQDQPHHGQQLSVAAGPGGAFVATSG